MVPVYKQNETIAVRKRVPIHLVDATDGITAKTGVTGTAKISKNYGTPVTSTNSIVEVDSTNQPGLYYIELDSSELDTLGWLAVRFKTAATAEYQIVCQIVQDDPYISHTGPGMSGGGVKMASGMKKEEMVELAKMVWNVILQGKQTAKDVLLSKSELTADEIPLPTNDEVLAAVAGLAQEIKAIPAPADYSEDLQGLKNASSKLLKASSGQDAKASFQRLETLLTDILTRVNATGDRKELTELASQLALATEGLAALPEHLNQHLESTTELLDETTSELMTTLREDISSLSSSQSLTTAEVTAVREELRKSIKGLLVSLTYAKYKPLLESRRL